jgi:hypothetical protein
LGRSPDETVWVSLIGGIQHHLPLSQDGLSLAKVDHGRGEQTQPRVAMLLVVPSKKLLTEGAAVLDAVKLTNGRTAIGIGAFLRMAHHTPSAVAATAKPARQAATR